LTDAGVEKGAETGPQTPTHPLRWRLTDAGVEKGSKNWPSDASASIMAREEANEASVIAGTVSYPSVMYRSTQRE
jgi:hypothetical protein